MMKSKAIDVVACALLLSATACAGGADEREATEGTGPVAEADLPHVADMRGTEQAKPVSKTSVDALAQIELPGERTVQFFEPKPGAIVEYEYGRADGLVAAQDELAVQDLDAMNFVERYEALAKQPAPATLRAAQARLDLENSRRAPADLHDEPLAGVDSAPAASQKARTTPRPISRTTFWSNYCVQTDRFVELYDWEFEEDWEYAFINYLKAGVYAVTGRVHIRARYDAWAVNEYLNNDVPEGYYAAIRSSSTSQAMGTVSISEVDGGDSFDLCINFHR